MDRGRETDVSAKEKRDKTEREGDVVKDESDVIRSRRDSDDRLGHFSCASVHFRTPSTEHEMLSSVGRWP